MAEHRNVYWLNTGWVEQFRKHASVIQSVEVDMSSHIEGMEADEDLTAALDFFGWKLPLIEPEDFNDVRDPEETRYYVSLERKTEVANPAALIIAEFAKKTPGSKDKFDLLRDLEQTIGQLREHLRGINDPTVITPTVTHALSYLSALKEFVSTKDAGPPDTIPVGLSQGTLSKLSKVDWFGVSDKAAKLVDNIRSIMDAVRMIF